MTRLIRGACAPLILALTATPALAQQDDDAPKLPHRTRVMLGPQIAPRYPGADSSSVFPIINVDRIRGDAPFTFEAPDESGGFSILRRNGFTLGPAYTLQGSRRRRDTDGALPRVGFTVELGAAVGYMVSPNLRVRAEARQGIGGHKGLIGVVSADYIARDADRWLFSVGPRLTLSNAKYNRAYYGVAPSDAAAAGIPAYDPRGGAQAIGGAASVLRQLGGRWGVYGFAKYDRLIDDSGRSPVVRDYGSRNQISGGVALTYTFG
ncbi:MipA/OmpV family protein [Sphingomonas sp. KR1UV-12]|uniref:MipA/OmpV family protein n=1 Tax=Sphingomonas aurea TaxID=3063994 RepID=A0ABT9EMR3_9SPHN|nr:MipA/OmpV family protein [Sphingomonas sp. KR1UV-12]MDP1028241.1 MipA/OmpV family protein [Sphingomonas sp. KR1UV-12]